MAAYGLVMVDGGKRLGSFLGVLAAVILLPSGAFADETLAVPSENPEYFSILEKLVLSNGAVNGSESDVAEPEEESVTADELYENFEGGSAGGYVNIGGPATSTFLTSAVSHRERERKLLDGVMFDLAWRPDVTSDGNHGDGWFRRSLTGNGLDRVGLRADVIALLRDEKNAFREGSAWRVSGMLGSTSLSLVDGEGEPIDGLSVGGGDFLWDVGVGWSSGAMSLSAGYQSVFSLSETGSEPSSLSIFSVGADYSPLPGLSLYGEVNMIDRLLDSKNDSFGAVVVVGTGVSF